MSQTSKALFDHMLLQTVYPLLRFDWLEDGNKSDHQMSLMRIVFNDLSNELLFAFFFFWLLKENMLGWIFFFHDVLEMCYFGYIIFKL